LAYKQSYKFPVTREKDEVKYMQISQHDVAELIQILESYRDTINSTRDLYMATISLQINDVVKTLTLFSIFLLPLTFIATMFGMNALNLNNITNPPLNFKILVLTWVAIVAFLFLYLRKRAGYLLEKVITIFPETTSFLFSLILIYC
jgi:magnesium transporter